MEQKKLEKYCVGCGSKKMIIEMPDRNFDTETGKRVVEKKSICMNGICTYGKMDRSDNLCPEKQETGYHKFGGFSGRCKCGESRSVF